MLFHHPITPTHCKLIAPSLVVKVPVQYGAVVALVSKPVQIRLSILWDVPGEDHLTFTRDNIGPVPL